MKPLTQDKPTRASKGPSGKTTAKVRARATQRAPAQCCAKTSRRVAGCHD